MKKSDFYFDLPENLIAQSPMEQRSNSRMMVVYKNEEEVENKHFYDVIDYLERGDCLVLNNTKVIPARIFGTKDTGAVVEFLLLKREDEFTWETLVKPGRKAKVGAKFSFGDGKLKAEVIGLGAEGTRIIKFEYEGIFEEILDELGNMPLPPYITEKLDDKKRYNTVYAKHDGSAAAPTAGLHFTTELMEKLEDKGVDIAFVTLHVGLGTFRPVKEEDILNHVMHSEFYMLDEENAKKINSAKENGGKIYSVGTTSTRTVESISDENGMVKAQSGWTDIFIYPGYDFKCIDGLITNFHLPESTLIMLISALTTREKIMKAYETAVEEEYRFFSFGDAMLITERRN